MRSAAPHVPLVSGRRSPGDRDDSRSCHHEAVMSAPGTIAPGMSDAVVSGRSVLIGVAVLLVATHAFAQGPQTGRDMYRDWCAVCHADDGTGRSPRRPVAQAPIDFTDCRMASSEPDVDWRLVITRGGPAAGLSAEMPAFETLTTDQVTELVAYLRAFCSEPGWPDGNLNFRRSIYTTKAFPEDEAVVTPVVAHGRTTYTRVNLEAAFGRRVGRRAEIEVSLPIESVGSVTGRVAGLGDVSVGGKYVLHADPRRPLIVTGGVEVSSPTGDRSWGFGEGSHVIQPFVAFGTLWRGVAIQGDVKGLIFTRRLPAEFYQRVVYDVSFSRDLSAAPDAWAIGVEISGADRALGMTPQVIKGLTRTGSLSAGFGVRLPLEPPFPQVRDLVRWTGFVLWEYRKPFRARR
jgi:mono/diheme cytochrome c family protein